MFPLTPVGNEEPRCAPKHRRSPNSSHGCFCPCKAKWLNMIYFKALLRDRGPGDSIWLLHYSSKPYYSHRILRLLELSNVLLYPNAVPGWGESRGRPGTRRWPVGSLELSLIARWRCKHPLQVLNKLPLGRLKWTNWLSSAPDGGKVRTVGNDLSSIGGRRGRVVVTATGMPSPAPIIMQHHP